MVTSIAGKLTYSMSEWLEAMKLSGASIPETEIQRLKDSDLTKWERLQILHQLIGLPIHEYYEFDPEEILAEAQSVQDFFRRFPSTIYSVKAEPQPEFVQTYARARKHRATRDEVYAFVHDLYPDPRHYRISIWEGFPEEYSGNLILSPEYGLAEMKKGFHRDLTQGYVTPGEEVHTVEFDPRDVQAPSHVPAPFSSILQGALNHLKVSTGVSLPYAVAHGLVLGYFEFVFNAKKGFRFFDFNTVLMDNWTKVAPLAARSRDSRAFEERSQERLQGRSAYPGVARGRAVVVRGKEEVQLVRDGDVLIAPITTTDYVPALNKVKGIACEWGGITSHPAIIARELKIPTIVGVGGLLDTFHTGETVEVNANEGFVRKCV